MKHKFRRTLTITLAFFAMLLSFALFAHAESGETERETFRGRIFSKDDIDVSGIEVVIERLILSYEDKESGIMEFDNIHYTTLTTDKNGYFEFEKPTKYCTYKINSDCIDSGYGLVRDTHVIDPGETYGEIEIRPVADIEIKNNRSGGVFAYPKDKDGNSLIAKYDVFPNLSYLKTKKSSGNMSSTETEWQYSDLKNIKAYNYSGTVKCGNITRSYSFDVDIDPSTEERINFLYRIGEISERRKIEFIEEFLNDKNEIKYCGTGYLDNIRDFYERAGEYEHIYKKGYNIDNYIPPACDDYVSLLMGSQNVVIYFTKSSFSGDDIIYLNKFKNDILDIYNYFCVENNFPCPYGAGGEALKIYITNGIDELGRTYPASSGGGSLIEIRESQVKSDIPPQTIAHEFMHAIQNTYMYSGAANWFKESMARMASMVYLFERNSTVFADSSAFYDFKQLITNYIRNYDKSLADSNPDSTLLYPLTIYQDCGGWDAIKEIYENKKAGFNDILSFGMNVGETYRQRFIRMSVYNSRPSRFYNIARSVYGWPEISSKNASLTSVTSDTVNNMANQYYKFSANSDMGTLKITATSNSEHITFTNTPKNSYDDREYGIKTKTFIVNNFGSAIRNYTITITNTIVGENMRDEFKIQSFTLTPEFV